MTCSAERYFECNTAVLAFEASGAAKLFRFVIIPARSAVPGFSDLTKGMQQVAQTVFINNNYDNSILL